MSELKSLNRFKVPSGEIVDVFIYLYYDKEIKPKNINPCDFFEACVYAIVKYGQSKEFHEVKIVKVKDRVLKKHKGDNEIESHLFNMECLLQIGCFEKMGREVEIELYVGGEMIGPSHKLRFTPSEIDKKQSYFTIIPRKISFVDEALFDDNMVIGTDRVNQFGHNILHYLACFPGQVERLSEVANKADVNLADCYGNTALHYAQMYNNSEGEKILISKGARTDIKNYRGFSYIDGISRATIGEKLEALLKKKGIETDINLGKLVTDDISKYYINKSTDKLMECKKHLNSIDTFTKGIDEFTSKKVIRAMHGVIPMGDIILDFDKERKLKGEIGDEKFALRLVLLEKRSEQDIMDESMSNILSPFGTMVKSRTSGKYHFAVAVGPWLIEWDEVSLIIPKKAYFNATFFIVETGFHIGNLDCDYAMSQLIGFSKLWNSTRLYSESTCNSWHMVKELFMALTGKTPTGPNADMFQQKGYIDGMVVKVPKTLGLTEFAKFDTHRDLEKFIATLENKGLMKDLKKTQSELSFMLSAYDRLFWLKYFKDASLSEVYDEKIGENKHCHVGDEFITL